LNLAGTGTNSSGLSVSGQITIIGTAIVQNASGLPLNNGAIYADGDIIIRGDAQVYLDCINGSALESDGQIRISNDATVGAYNASDSVPSIVASGGILVEGGLLETGQGSDEGLIAIQGNVTVLGGEVLIYDTLVGNLIVQGGDVYGGLDVSGNVTVSGGNAAVADIAGNLTVTGGQTIGADSVAGDLIVSGGNVTINGAVGGVVAATGGNVTIGGVPLSSNATLTSVAGQPITAVGTGTQNSPKTASISVPNSKTSISASEIVAATIATKKLSSTNAFSNNLISAPLAVGSNHLYILITAQNGTSKLYYDITVTRAAPSNPDVKDPSSDPLDTKTASVTAVRTPIKTLYIKKGKTLAPAVAFDGNDANGKAWGYGQTAKLAWKSSKTSVATVNPTTGKISAKKLGTAKITATALNGQAKLTFTVKVVKKAAKLNKVTLTKPPKTLAIGSTKVLKVKLSSAKATGIKVTFKSSKPSVLKVDKAGKLYAAGKGAANITVKAGGKIKVISVRVK
jgi:hypothetical protein